MAIYQSGLRKYINLPTFNIVHEQQYMDSNYSCDAVIPDEGNEFNISGYFQKYHLHK